MPVNATPRGGWVAVTVTLSLTLGAGACSDPPAKRACPIERGLPDQWTLRARGIEVVVHRAPYAISIRDGAGRPVLDSLGAGTGDGYAGLAWTGGKVFYTRDFSPGYTEFDSVLEAWRDDLVVASAS